MSALFYLGCQGWAHPTWPGHFFTRKVRREEQMAQYAGVFNAVEGNTTFYALQPPATIRKWCDEAPAHLKFCFKFHQDISHKLRLAGAEAATREFFDRLAPFGERLGPFFLQLEDTFGPKELPVLAAYLKALPRDYRYIVEVRHAAFFDGGVHERAVDELLGACGAERANFDTTGVFAAQGADAHLREAKRKKPSVPFRATALGQSPFVRFVGDPVVENNQAALEAWARRFAGWIAEGRRPWFFAHHADDTYSPDIARIFHRKLHELSPAVLAPAEWPAERETAAGGTQLGLF
jgi:uncharacterized protein YecE (DUF72 family)